MQDIPVATAVLSQLAVPAATMLLEQLTFSLVGLTQFAQADHGLVIGRILVMRVWDVGLTLTAVISATSVSLVAAVGGCVMVMLGGQDTTTAVVLTAISVDSLVPI